MGRAVENFTQFLGPEYRLSNYQQQQLRVEVDAEVKERTEALLKALECAYIYALGTAPDSHRIKNQGTLCCIRDTIAEATGRDSQSVQEHYEAAVQLIIDSDEKAGAQ